MGQRPPRHPERMRERQGIRIPRPRQRAQRGLVRERAEREVREQEPPRLLPHQVRLLAPQHALRPAQMRLEFVERGLHLPAFGVERRQFVGRGPVGLEHGGDQPIGRGTVSRP